MAIKVDEAMSADSQFMLQQCCSRALDSLSETKRKQSVLDEVLPRMDRDVSVSKLNSLAALVTDCLAIKLIM